MFFFFIYIEIYWLCKVSEVGKYIQYMAFFNCEMTLRYINNRNGGVPQYEMQVNRHLSL